MCKVLRTLCGTPRGYNIFSTSRIIQRLCFYENFEKGAVEFTGKILWVKKRLPVLVLSLLLMHVTGSHGAMLLHLASGTSPSGIIDPGF